MISTASSTAFNQTLSLHQPRQVDVVNTYLSACVQPSVIKQFFGYMNTPVSSSLSRIKYIVPAESNMLEDSKMKAILFSTGDPFVTLQENPLNKAVEVSLTHDALNSGDYATNLMVAFQACWAARENGAENIELHLPASLDPNQNRGQLSQLLVKLAQAIGADRIRYTDESPVKHSPKLQPHCATESGILEQMHEVTRLSDYAKARSLNMSYDDEKQAIAEALQSIEPSEPQARHLVFGTHINRSLAKDITKQLQNNGDSAQLVSNRYTYDNAETMVDFPGDIRDCTVTIATSTRPVPTKANADQYKGSSASLLEALLLAQTAKNRGARSVEMVFAYQPSARSDKRESSTAPNNFAGAYSSMIGKFCDALNISRTLIVEPHDQHSQTYFTNSRNQGISVPGLLHLSKLILKTKEDRENAVLVSPDDGAVKRTKALRKELGLELLSAQKERNSHADDSAKVTSLGSGAALDPSKLYLVTDDETATGGTLCQVLTKLRSQGGENIVAAICHNNMPLDLWERNACLARFIHAGARQVHFLDTQPMGKIALNWKEFVKFGQQSGKSEQDIIKWVAQKCFQSDTISEVQLDEFKACIKKAAQNGVVIHPVGKLIADTLVGG